MKLASVYSPQLMGGDHGAFFGVCTRTVERRRRVERFREVMERARAKGRVSVRRNLFRVASNGNVAAAIFLAKNLHDLDPISE